MKVWLGAFVCMSIPTVQMATRINIDPNYKYDINMSSGKENTWRMKIKSGLQTYVLLPPPYRLSSSPRTHPATPLQGLSFLVHCSSRLPKLVRIHSVGSLCNPLVSSSPMQLATPPS